MSTKAAKITRGGKESRRESVISWLFIAPSLIGVLLFYIAPFAVVVYYSMIDSPINGQFVFLDNFISVFKNSAFQLAGKNTLIFSGLAVPGAVILSILLAMLLDSNIPLRSLFRTFFLSPMTVPVASVVLIWQVIFHYNGVLNDVLGSAFGFAKIDWLKSDFNRLVVVALFWWKNLGYNMILFLAALNNVPKNIIEGAMLEGAGSFRIFWSIKIRYLSSTILFVTILSLINSFKVFREVYLLTGNYPYDGIYLLQHFMNNTFGSLDYQKLSAAAIIMAVVVVAIIGVLFIAEGRFGKDVEG